MRTLEELRKTVIPLPSRFAGSVTGDDNISPSLDFENGFTRDYSTKYSSGGKYLQRNDFNKLGETSTREPLFKQAGGWHTFANGVGSSSTYGGYPSNSMLLSFDGDYAKRVESTEESNTKPFAATKSGVPYIAEIPDVIDCLVKKPSESSNPNILARVLWRTAGRIYGVPEGLLTLKFDYTRAQHLASGDVVKEDSIVIGTYIGFFVYRQNLTVASMLPITHTTRISDGEGTHTKTTTNKGRCGDAVGFIYLAGWNPPRELPVPKVTGGTGNYSMCYFAKAGTSFSGTVKIYNQAGEDILADNKDIQWTAIPIVPSIVTEEEDA